jgi:hypothetical protein
LKNNSVAGIIKKADLHVLIWAVFVVKLVIVLMFSEGISTYEDTNIAQNMLNTGKMFFVHFGAENYNYQLPVFPFVLYILYGVFGFNQIVPIIMQLLLTSVIAYMLFWIFLEFMELIGFTFPRLSNSVIAKFAVLLFLLHPFIAKYSMFDVHPLVFNMFFPVATLFFTLRYFSKKKLTRSFPFASKDLLLLALSLGLATLDRTTNITAIVPFLIIGYRRLGIRHLLPILTVPALGVAIFMLPWLFRSYHYNGNFNSVSTIEETLWQGVLYGSDGSNLMLDGRPYEEMLTENEKAWLEGRPVSEQERFFMEKYRQILKTDPAQIIRMYFIKLKNFWWFHKNAATTYPSIIKTLLPLYKVFYLLILLLTLISLPGLKFSPLLLLSYPLTLSLLYAYFYVETRHRLVIEPFLLFTAILGFLTILRKVRKHYPSPSTLP